MLELTTENRNVKLRQLANHTDDFLYWTAVDLNREHLSRYGLDTAEKYKTFDDVVEAREHPRNLYRLRMGIWAMNRFVGSANFTINPSDTNEAEIGFWIQEKYIGHGYGRVAVNALANHARYNGFHRVTALPSAENKPAITMLEDLGFQATDTQPNGNLMLVKDLTPIELSRDNHLILPR